MHRAIGMHARPDKEKVTARRQSLREQGQWEIGTDRKGGARSAAEGFRIVLRRGTGRS